MQESEKFFKVSKLSEIREGEGKVVYAGVKKLALFYIEGKLYCIQNHCPHAGGFLGLGEVKGHDVLCPRHCWRFDVRNGECRTDPRYRAQSYSVKVEGDDIYVAIPEKGVIV